MKLYKGILHTADFTKEMIRGVCAEEEQDIITAYMKAWDGIHVTLSGFVPGEYSVVGWPPEEEERVKEAIYLLEQDPFFGLYKDDRAGFDAAWESGEWEPSGSFVFHADMVEIIGELGGQQA